MANSTRVLVLSLLLSVSIFASARLDEDGSEDIPSAVLTLDASNFHETIAKHPFIVVEFFAPWCGHCKKLEPEYEKAAALLNEHDPPIVLAKVNANDEINKELASEYEISGFPTLKILRNEGKSVRDYKGPREADGIVEYLKREVGPASNEIISSDVAANLLVESKKVSIIGIFPVYSGEEFDNFTVVAEKLRSDYHFGHISDAKLLPLGDTSLKGPIIRLFKPFDELFVDFQDFHAEALENFIEVASTPIVTTFDKDPLNHPFVMKFFNNQNVKAMLYINFSDEHIESFKSKFYQVAEIYKGKKMSFLLGDLEASQGAFKFFGLSEDQVPLLFLQEIDGKKFLKPNLESDQISTWMKEYTDGKLTPFIKSEPIPESNDEAVKVVVANSLQQMVLDSHKNVLLEFYAPWCGHCKKLAPILDEVALSFKDDAAVLIAKMDATANDVPAEFQVKGYPTLYFSPASGEKLQQYDGPRTADDIINFINTNKDAVADVISESAVDSLKDEL